jgi:hypothetical protein
MLKVARPAVGLATWILLAIVGVAEAQQASGIAGVVRDTSGAVLPGVTVEAASPALIEQVRTVTTDGQGRYSIVELRTGTYSVTFRLQGFGTVTRQGVELTAGFTATINADLAIGTVQETVTVTGASPLVDTQNVRRQTVASSELLAALPTSTKHLNTLITLTPGFTGLAAVTGAYSAQIGSTGISGAGAYHGKSGTKVSFDGMGIDNMQFSGNSSYQVNSAAVQDMVLETGGISAETNADGPVVNVIPREGGNIFSGNLSALYSDDSLESSNLTDLLRDRGLTTENKTLNIYDYSVSAGGPVKRDRIWFFGTGRSWGFAKQHAGVYWNKTQGTELTPRGAERVVVLYTPWVDRPLDRTSGRWEWYNSYFGRATWQATSNNKVSFTTDYQKACNCGSTSAAVSQEATLSYHFKPNKLFQLHWTSPVTSRLLLEASAGWTISHFHEFLMPGVEWHHVPITDQGLGISYGGRTQLTGYPNQGNRYTQRFAVSYVTGSHQFKTGVHVEEGVRNTLLRGGGGSASYTFRNGVPVNITQRSTPYITRDGMTDLGIYAQDRWTLDRLTLNLGLRLDVFNGYVREQHVPATPNGWIPERNFARVDDVPAWTDVNPRIGAAYDVFGNSRTAVKASLGRYLSKTAVDVATAVNPIATSVNQVSRSWSDTNQNYVPDCDLATRTANGECGAMSNLNFGGLNIVTQWDDTVLSGFGVREYNWDFAAEIQHELMTGMSITGGYYRNWYGNLRVTDNLSVTPADYSPYCVTAPADTRLPGGGGFQVCGLYDLDPSKFGQASSLVTHASNYGDQKRVNDFFGVTVNARLGERLQFGGGVDTGRSLDDRCFVVDSPMALLHCRVVTPFAAQTQFKTHGSYMLPGDFGVSAVYQSLPGPAFGASYAATLAQITPSLGRNLAGGATTATVPLVAPQTLFEDRISRLDVRVTKRLRLSSRLGLQLNADAYNVLNSSSILLSNSTFGAQWRRPNTIIDPRILQFSGAITF